MGGYRDWSFSAGITRDAVHRTNARLASLWSIPSLFKLRDSLFTVNYSGVSWLSRRAIGRTRFKCQGWNNINNICIINYILHYVVLIFVPCLIYDIRSMRYNKSSNKLRFNSCICASLKLVAKNIAKFLIIFNRPTRYNLQCFPYNYKRKCKFMVISS